MNESYPKSDIDSAPISYFGTAEQLRNEPDKIEHNRQQDKIISIIQSNNYNLLGQKFVAAPTADAREKFLSDIRNGVITANTEKKFLERIALPGQKADGVIDYTRIAERVDLGKNPDEAQEVLLNSAFTIESFTKGSQANKLMFSGMDSGDAVYSWSKDKTNADFAKIILDKCPTPVDFEMVNDELVDFFNGETSGEEKAAYMNGLKEMKQAIYGKRFEYSEQFEVLVKEALETGDK